MCNTIILASHGNLSQGMKDTAEMIVGSIDNLYALSAFRDDDEPIKEQLIQLIRSKNKQENIYILTDILGGSVNNDIMEVLNEYSNINIITGMNLPLVISLVVQTTTLDEVMLKDIIKECKNSIINCNLLLHEEQSKNNIEGGEEL